MDISIVFEDDAMLAVNKPSGMTVNRSETTAGETTLQDVVETWFTIEDNDPASDFFKRSGIVHRLDKETSGVLLIAKTPHAFAELQRQFKERLVHKSYQALIHGVLNPQEGEISVPVGRLPWNRTRFGVLAGGREAVTHYKLIRKFLHPREKEILSLVELYPRTGRTHQIRVHLKYMNRPIFSDPLYAGRKTIKRDRKYLDRLFLHAWKISFSHPVTKKSIDLTCELPNKLSEFVKSLQDVDSEAALR